MESATFRKWLAEQGVASIGMSISGTKDMSW
jgi:hypothetical protein